MNNTSCAVMDESNRNIRDRISLRPAGWLETPLTLTMEKTHLNLVATLATNAAADKLIIANDLFLAIRDRTSNCDIEATYPFFIHSYSHWLAALRCWASQHIPPCYALGRASIECTLYGNFLHLHDNDDALKQIYIDRKGANGKPTKAFRDRFSTRSLLDALPNPPRDLAHTLYEFSIDFGAHPNLLAVFQGIIPAPDERQHHVYIGANEQSMSTGANYLLSVALCSLMTFDKLLSKEIDDALFEKTLFDLGKSTAESWLMGV